jgi:xanthine dehydrogenase YagR molybdenum-binding subunit
VIARRRGADSNVSGERARGDKAAAEAALESADVTVELTVELPVQHHVCLETHGQMIVPDERGATVYASSQAVKSEPAGFAGALGLKQREVRVITQHMGGGFGSKFGGGVEAEVCGRIVKETKRPVHLLLTREQEFQMAGNRSGSWQHLRVARRATASSSRCWPSVTASAGWAGARSRRTRTSTASVRRG